ncbi:hypothetical protein F5B17DRAFT_407541 [Nemania serpens]|nr:hypothetical protein F5B17DRAFT_407541 [Nemania serpens]
MDQRQLDIVQSHPFGTQLVSVRTSLSRIVPNPVGLNTASHEVLRDQALALLPLLLNHPAGRALPSVAGRSALRNDLLELENLVDSGRFDPNRIRPLLNAVLTNATDSDIWEQAYNAVTKLTLLQKGTKL